jgi:hypothetical protein
MIYNADKIVPGVILFLVVLSLPLLYTLATGKADEAPELKIVTAEKQCIESTEYMRKEHMNLLKSQWRETVVRTGIRTYLSSAGKEYDMSLTQTCLGCHSNKEQFCDQCHNYVGVQPVCWNCHNIPEGES